MATGQAKHHDYHLVDPSPWPFVGSASAVAAAQDLVKDKEVLQNTVVKSAEDVASVGSIVGTGVRDFLGLGDSLWRRWLVRGGVAAVALVGARVAFGGELKAARAAVSTVVEKAKEAHAEITRSAA